MHRVISSRVMERTVWKSCVKLVANLRTAGGVRALLSTNHPDSVFRMWENRLGYAGSLHTIRTQFYTPKLCNFTEAVRLFSPLSTPLIISTSREKKEKLLIGQRG